MAAAFTEAASKQGIHEERVAFAERDIRLRFAGRVIAPPLLRAFAERARDGEMPVLTIHVWDQVSSEVPVPQPTWSWEAGVGRGEIPGLGGSAVRVALDPVAGAVSVYDAASQSAYFWIRDARRLPFQTSAAPFRTILHWWAILQGLQLAHVAAVGTPAGGCLLVGKAGSGKSTTAIASLLTGLGYLGDDCCVVGHRGEPYAWNAYASAKLNADAFSRFPELESHTANPSRRGSEKAVIFVNEALPKRLLAGFPIRALLVPRITGQPLSSARRISAAAGFVALAPSTIFQLPLADARTSNVLSEVASRVPCYELRLGEDPRAAVEVIRGLIT